MRLVEPGLVGGNAGTEGPGVEWARALLDSLQMRRVRDPLAAEMAASVVAASWRPEAQDGPSDPVAMSAGQLEAAAAEMIDAIAAVRRTDALVLLVGLAAVAPGPLASRALELAATLETSGVRAPRWLAEVGRAEVFAAWRMSHVLGDGDNIVLGARYSAGSEHSLVVYVDHNLGGLAKDVFPAGPADEVLTMFADAAGHDPDVSIDPMELGGRGGVGTRGPRGDRPYGPADRDRGLPGDPTAARRTPGHAPARWAWTHGRDAVQQPATAGHRPVPRLGPRTTMAW